ncbi:MAG: hypothetical protein UT63_C0078G0003 [Candidatus Gottesmanbacteria bacterium GW2011_GWC2_39_8]|uniref:Uncharacterized protein n=1 Tax=Candidatus Gottesmanbacteria bacterium GW2011_GWC2_39_8 TaxID=1618450 RepID=A0A0G0PTJ7_9BACT|nr:MAG: hypothetical protein UT63_C0078G0003 [Candidatus Gottesmanbacteria bacterium GW2011_GWC2_39_8]
MSIKFQKISNNLIILIILIFSVFILIHVLFPVELISAISDNFNKVAIGIAALITAYFGSSYFREELSRKRSIKFYREKYPPQQHGKTYKFIESVKTPGAIFLLDLQSLHKHHVWNMKTMYDMGWQVYLPAEQLPDENFLSYLIGDPIRTRGDLGE